MSVYFWEYYIYISGNKHEIAKQIYLQTVKIDLQLAPYTYKVTSSMFYSNTNLKVFADLYVPATFVCLKKRQTFLWRYRWPKRN